MGVISRSKTGTTVRIAPRSASLPRLHEENREPPQKKQQSSRQNNTRRGRSMTRNAYSKSTRTKKSVQLNHVKEQIKQAEISHTEKHRRWEDARERVAEAEFRYD